MKRVLVHLHIYYPQQIDYFINKMGNIVDVEWDLYVTYSELPKDAFSKLKSFKPSVQFLPIENIGYDIWPFLSLIRALNLKDYDYVIKLHTKRELPPNETDLLNQSGFYWRNTLVDSILFSQNHFRNILKILDQKKKIGMICARDYYLKEDLFQDFIKKELQKLGLLKMSSKMEFGSIFMIRSYVLESLKTDIISRELFSKHAPLSGSSISMAHIYERLFSHLSPNYGLRNYPITYKKNLNYKSILVNPLINTFRFLFTIDRSGLDQKKFVKLFGVTIYKSKRGKNDGLYEKISKILEYENSSNQ